MWWDVVRIPPCAWFSGWHSLPNCWFSHDAHLPSSESLDVSPGKRPFPHPSASVFPKDCGQSSLVPSQFLGEGLYLLAWPSPWPPGDGGIGITADRTDLTAQGIHQVPARGSWSPWSTLPKPFRWWWRGDTSSAQEQTEYLGVFLAPKDYGKFGQLIIMW